MRRGELYRVRRPAGDRRPARVFMVVSRDVVIQSRFSMVICAPVYSAYDDLASQLPVGTQEGLKRESAVHCDALVSIEKTRLTAFVGTLSPARLTELDAALVVALGIGEMPWDSTNEL